MLRGAVARETWVLAFCDRIASGFGAKGWFVAATAHAVSDTNKHRRIALMTNILCLGETEHFKKGIKRGWRVSLVTNQSVRENISFAPLGLDRFPLAPTACAVGCILTPLRG
jgi:hypothetical protein